MKRPLAGLVAPATVSLTAALLLGACGSDPPPPPKVPTAAEVRTYWGLNPGSCWVYKDLTGGSGGITSSVDGPDTVRIAGRTTYIYSRATAAAPSSPDEFLIDVDTTPGTMFLARETDGTVTPRVVDTYLDEPRPQWGVFDYDSAGALELFPDNTLETASTPRGATAAIAHKWTVVSRAEMLSTPDGVKPGLLLRYFKDNVRQATYGLVPNFGIASFEIDGTNYQVCLARVCDAAGACTGVETCAAAFCP